ncbi:unnamed protein product [Linum trigynum]|uniref:Uncharacterized protein n=1 Tax=Linum trigynum TaxID=586398 RepID=A0AAV2FME4_9ROSI
MLTTTLIMATKWKDTRQLGIPMTVVEAISTEHRPPMMEPRFAVSANHPRLLLSVDRGVTMASPIPFRPLVSRAVP